LADDVDRKDFLSHHGVRSLSKAHQQQPFQFGGRAVGYEPGEAVEKLKGGNSNWRGPVWFPTSFLIIESLRKLEKAFGGDVKVALHAGDFATREQPLAEAAMTDTRAEEGIGAGAARARGRSISTAVQAAHST